MRLLVMSSPMHPLIIRTITGLLLATVFWVLYLYAPPIMLSLLFLTTLLGILVLEWPRLVPFKGIAGGLFTLLYPVLPIVCILLLNHCPAHRELLAVIYVMIPSFDTGAYCAGTMLGKTKLWPTLSPDKTWEGVIGGTVAAWLGLVWYTSGSQTSWASTLLITLLIAPLALLGDLFESRLKRRAGVKDSGFLLPGHGGLLDRLDSVLLVSVACYLLRNQLMLLIG